jgi:hypothetical protein
MNNAIFRAVRSIAVPVTDQDRAKGLLERFGFTVSMDTELQPGFRWIEMTLADSDTTLALIRCGEELPAGIDTGIRLATSDARAARDAVVSAGLDAGELLDWETAPLMFSFLDPDGNRFYVSEAR